MSLDIHQNDKAKKSDNTNLPYAQEEAETWGRVHTPCRPHSRPGPYSAVPSMSHRDLQEDPTVTLPGKARVSRYLVDATNTMLRTFHKSQHPNVHLEGGLGRPRLNAKKTTSDAGSGWRDWRHTRAGRDDAS